MFNFKAKRFNIQTDEELVTCIVNGQVEAFNELYARYNKRLLYYFYRMLGNNQDLAQDFLQDIFFKLINKPELYNPERKFSTWIYSVAHNMCKNEYRSKDVRKVLVKSENPDLYSEPVTEVKNREQLIAEVFRELESFDNNQKTAFLLKYREGFSIEEISETLELPVGTIKSRLFYTRKKLKEILMGKYADIIENLF